MTGFRRSFSWYGGGPRRFGNFNAMMTSWRHSVMNAPFARSLALFFLLCLLLGAFLSTRFLADPSSTSKSGSSSTSAAALGLEVNSTQNSNGGLVPELPRKKIEIPLNCTALNATNTCPRNYPTEHSPVGEDGDGATCPEYFRWIYEDLRPWNGTGITRVALESGRRTANFRLVVLNGRVYVEQFQKSFQSRDAFTVWGILQLLRKYPGKVPDLELMFDCVDWPVVLKKFYNGLEPDLIGPPPLFRYCANDATLDIVFPDWSFWGWPEINIKPWDSLLKDLEEGNKRTKWIDREPYAYWKGNPSVAATREDLMKCNVSEGQDWSVRVFAQDWIRESQQGYKQSDLASQCIHRYKIYIEGSAWSVSEKYILACDSVTLIVKPHYYDFFTRGLLPVHHYWPIREDDKCRSLKFAVDWGNRHKQKAQEIGKAASKFILEDLKMENVYDYMFHLLNEYAKLLRFKPEVPENATELCSESMACSANGLEKKFMMESLVMGPSERSPCNMATPYDAHSLYHLKRKKGNIIKHIELWEKQFWEQETGQQ